MIPINRVHQAPVFIVLAAGLAVAAALFLFIIRAFEPYGWAYFPGEDPASQTAWQKFGFDPTTPDRILYPVVFFSLVAPVATTVLGVTSRRIKSGPGRLITLWLLFFIFAVAVLSSLSKFGIFFFPAAAFFLAALVEENRAFLSSRKPDENHLVAEADKAGARTRLLAAGALIAALGALYFLLFVPLFKPYVGVIFPGSLPPEPVTAWERFAIWPPMRDIPPDPLVLIAFTLPAAAAALAFLSTMTVKEKYVRRNMLWVWLIILLVPVSLFLGDFSVLFLPSAILLFAAAVMETRSTRKGSLE